MKKFVVMLLLIWSQTAIAQWQPLNGPGGSSFYCLAEASYGIFCGTVNGLYQSSNEGATWQRMNAAPNQAYIDLLNVNDTLVALYDDYTVGNSNSGTWSIASFDHGNSWSPPALIENYSVWPMMKLYHQGNSLFVQGQTGCFMSTDDGLSWNTINTPNGDDLHDAYFFGSYFYMSTINYNTYHASSFVSTNGSLNWIPVDTLNSVSTMIVDSVLFHQVYDTSANYYLIRTFDMGQHWDTIRTWSSSANEGYYVVDNILYYSIYPGNATYLTSDYGQTWTSCPPPVGLTYTDGITLSSGNLLSIRNYNLVQYVPAANTFFTSYTGVVARSSGMLRVYNGRILYPSGSDFIYSDDGGLTWPMFNSKLPGIINMKYSNDTIVAISSGMITKSIDNGLTWDTAAIPQSTPYDVPGLAILNGVLYYAGYQSNYYSNDLGETWMPLPALPTPPGTCGISIIDNGVLVSDSQFVYIVTNGGLIYRYDPSQNSWLYSTCFWSPGAHTGNILYKVDNYIVMCGQEAILYSTDQGLTWTSPLLQGLPVDNFSIPIIPRTIVSQNGLWIGTCGSYGIYASSDHGDNWFTIPTPGFTPGGVALLNNILYCSSVGTSMWRRSGTMHQWTGRLYIDNNGNSLFDAGDIPFTEIAIHSIPSSFVTNTDSLGIYSLVCDVVGDTIRPFTASPHIHFSPAYYLLDSNQLQNLDFIVSIDSSVSDFSADLTDITCFRPGFWSDINITASNNGTFDQPGKMQLIFPSQRIHFIFSDLSPSYINSDTVRWDLDTIGAFHSTSFRVEFITDTLAVIGDTLNLAVLVAPSIQDTFPGDNLFMLHDTVVGAYDPNEKTCAQGAQVVIENIQAGEGLDYIIRFQNTGSLMANFVHIIDTLSQLLDWSTFQIVSESHQVTWSIDPHGVVEFDFSQINLPDSGSNERQSHGYVKYRIKCRHDVMVGNAVLNSAFIYFDFNPPIQTNTVTTLIIDNFILGAPSVSFNPEIEMKAYPNPVQSVLHVQVYGNSGKKHLLVYNAIGKQLLSQIFIGDLYEFNVGNLENGLYLIKILSEDGAMLSASRVVVEK